MGYVNKARHHVVNRSLVEDRRLRPHQYGTVFEQTFWQSSTLPYADHNIIPLKALANLCTYEELYVDYGESYAFTA